ncbi:cytochrome C oxidase subunit IV family protein [Natronococcus sp. A-GB1]|uniref:cytochrome C oxidase subunit IV family protein n=1 Tax=unclassified Natronococcus TaxID=2623058 RepID=UPI00241FD314|nr:MULTISPECIES: cytochrome C oxidase subunit IV family protein [unclassified Natronococcus]MDG5760856.1 cytochrome C oxidase subunit IV family protein [Natronococcus sp. A-GB1]MDG5819874.1 cytochrome C oxidase subunit IV family protein [Natronococcus sp. A-GB7]
MADVRTYTLIYVVLLVLGTGKFVFFQFPEIFPEAAAIGGTIILAVIKVLLIAAYYQHLIEEPRAITYMMGIAVFMVFLLTIAAGYSIQ